MNFKNAADRLVEMIDKKRNPCVVGLDPYMKRIPSYLKGKFSKGSLESIRDLFLEFNRSIIDSVSDIVPAVKPQVAFYERYGRRGIEALEKTVEYAKEKDLIVILDAKRNDIGNTAQAYADGYLGVVEMVDGSTRTSYDGDFVTVNPYLGEDGVSPFLEVCKNYGKGIFVLVKTSNPSSADFQDRNFKGSGNTLYEEIAKYVGEVGLDLVGERGYSSVGAVTGATYPEAGIELRELMPKNIFLVPGYGAQGGGAKDIVPFFDDDGYGAVVNSTRDILYAYDREPYNEEFGEEKFEQASRRAAIDMKKDIIKALRGRDKLPW